MRHNAPRLYLCGDCGKAVPQDDVLVRSEIWSDRKQVKLLQSRRTGHFCIQCGAARMKHRKEGGSIQ